MADIAEVPIQPWLHLAPTFHHAVGTESVNQGFPDVVEERIIPGTPGFDAKDTGNSRGFMTLDTQEAITRIWGETFDGGWKMTTLKYNQRQLR